MAVKQNTNHNGDVSQSQSSAAACCSGRKISIFLFSLVCSSLIISIVAFYFSQHQYHSLDKEFRSLQEEFIKLKNAGPDEQVDAVRNRVSDIENNHKQRLKALAANTSTELQRQAKRQSAELEAGKNEIAEMKSEMKSEIAEIQSEIAEIQSEIAEIQSEIAEMKSQVKGEIAEIQSAIAHLLQDIGQIKTDVRQNDQDVDMAVNQNTRQQEEINATIKEVEDTQSALAESTKELQKLKDVVEGLEVDVDWNKKTTSHLEQQFDSDIREKISELSVLTKKMNTNFQGQFDEIARNQSLNRIEDPQQELNQIQDRWAVLQRGFEEIIGMSGVLNRTNEKLETRMTYVEDNLEGNKGEINVLANRLQNLEVDSETTQRLGQRLDRVQARLSHYQDTWNKMKVLPSEVNVLKSSVKSLKSTIEETIKALGTIKYNKRLEER